MITITNYKYSYLEQISIMYKDFYKSKGITKKSDLTNFFNPNNTVIAHENNRLLGFSNVIDFSDFELKNFYQDILDSIYSKNYRKLKTWCKYYSQRYGLEKEVFEVYPNSFKENKIQISTTDIILELCYILPEYRNKGIANQMWDLIEENITKTDAKQIFSTPQDYDFWIKHHLKRDYQPIIKLGPVSNNGENMTLMYKKL